MVTPNNTTATVAVKVREALSDAGISDKKAADMTGIARSTLARRLAGYSPFTVTELASIASLLGLDDFTDLLRQSESGAVA